MIFLLAGNAVMFLCLRVLPSVKWQKLKESLKTNSEKIRPIQALAALHESASLRSVTGSLLRPGGFRLTERGLSFCVFPPAAQIVDIGCGTGASVAYLREKHRYQVLGFDVSEDLLRDNDLAEYLPLALARAEELPLAQEVCDGILCECVLSLVLEPNRALSEFSRVLRSGGYLIVSDLYDRVLEEKVMADVGEGTSVLRTHNEIESLVAAAGFELMVWEDHTRYLRELAVQLIFSHGSLAGFCDFLAASGSGCAGTSTPMTSPVPGYFLMVAQKK